MAPALALQGPLHTAAPGRPLPPLRAPVTLERLSGHGTALGPVRWKSLTSPSARTRRPGEGALPTLLCLLLDTREPRCRPSRPRAAVPCRPLQPRHTVTTSHHRPAFIRVRGLGFWNDPGRMAIISTGVTPSPGSRRQSGSRFWNLPGVGAWLGTEGTEAHHRGGATLQPSSQPLM